MIIGCLFYSMFDYIFHLREQVVSYRELYIFSENNFYMLKVDTLFYGNSTSSRHIRTYSLGKANDFESKGLMLIPACLKTRSGRYSISRPFDSNHSNYFFCPNHLILRRVEAKEKVL